MRVVVVVVAALVATSAAYAHAEVSPTAVDVDRVARLTMQVPCESATAATVRVEVTAARGLVLGGKTTWTGHTRDVARLRFTARASTSGDYTLRVRQLYSDGEVAHWTPLLHAEGAQNENRDRLLIAIVVAIVLVVVFALRGRGRKRPQ